MTGAPLAGCRIVELTHVWSGPLCGQILADLGAEVIRIESPSRLDIHRRGGPYPEGKAGINRSGTWNAQNRGKRSCTLDLKTAEGKDLLLQLVQRSDAVIENFTPDALNRLGLGYAAMCKANERIVLLSLSGYGHTGPFRDSLAYGPMMDAATGLSASTTYGDGIPRAANGWAADVGGALYGCAALVRRLLDDDRQASHIDVSQFEAGVMFLAEALMVQTNGGAIDPVRHGFAFTVPTAGIDKWLAVAPRTLEEITALCDVAGGPEATLRVVRLLNSSGAEAARIDLEGIVHIWAMHRDQHQAVDALRRAGVPAVPVATVQDLLDDPQLAARGAWLQTEHAQTGRTLSYGPAIRIAGMPVSNMPAPILGADNDYVFNEVLGLAERHHSQASTTKPVQPERNP